MSSRKKSRFDIPSNILATDLKKNLETFQTKTVFLLISHLLLNYEYFFEVLPTNNSHFKRML